MWLSYLQTAVRALLTGWRHAIVTIGGLIVGLACCILALLFVENELSYDRAWPHAERLYRVHTEFAIPGTARQASAATMGPLKTAMLREISDIETAARLNVLHPTFKRGAQVFSEDVSFIDPEFLSMFSIAAVQGDIDRQTWDTTSLIVTQSFASRYLPSNAAIGEVLTLSFFKVMRDYRVIAVIPDPPSQTHLTYQAFALIDENDFTDQPWMFKHWTSVNNYTYLRLKPGANAASLPVQLNVLVDRNFSDWPVAASVVPSQMIRLSVMNVQDLQLGSVGTDELKPVGDFTTVFLFIAIAGLILLVACINFVNLSTAQSMGRAREVAIRKVVGAGRGELLIQFLSESVLHALLALCGSLLLVTLCLPQFTRFAGKALSADRLIDPPLLAVLVGTAICIGLLSGLYPAVFVSRFRPATILKGETPGAGKGGLRRFLVILQFAVATWLLVATGVVYSQMTYLRGAKLGFDSENTLLIHRVGRDRAAPVTKALKDEILRQPGIEAATLAESAPGNDFEYNARVRLPGLGNGEPPLIGYRLVDEGFFRVYGIRLTAGRYFSADRTTDRLPEDLETIPFAARKGAVIVNAAAIRYLGLGSPQAAVGRSFVTAISGRDSRPVPITLKIVGTTGNVHFRSLKETVRPEMYIYGARNYQILSVRYGPLADPSAVVSAVQVIWRKMIPDVPFRAEFLSDVIARQYAVEARHATVFAAMSGLSIMIGCLGLYGLAAHVTMRRTGEIGIRKVLGASTSGIVRLFLQRFSLPIAAANLLAWPIALYFAGQWLTRFEYRIDLWTYGPALCAAALVLTVVVAWITIISQVLRTARLNPADSLRHGSNLV